MDRTWLIAVLASIPVFHPRVAHPSAALAPDLSESTGTSTAIGTRSFGRRTAPCAKGDCDHATFERRVFL